jgi:hypothetical protein
MGSLNGKFWCGRAGVGSFKLASRKHSGGGGYVFGVCSLEVGLAVELKTDLFFRCADQIAHWQILQDVSMQGMGGLVFSSTVGMWIVERMRCICCFVNMTIEPRDSILWTVLLFPCCV